MPNKPQFLIAAPASGSGKTTITLGLLRAFANRGIKVQPFKCGPDYIDTILHKKSSGMASINLDTYMASADHVQTLYHKYLQQADMAIVEGVMGLFDGADKMKGSSAEIAVLLGIPVILVINARAMAYSAAALIYGFKNFHPAVKIAGVIFNNVNTVSHYAILKDACNDTGVEALGYLPPHNDINIPSRHLGLSIASSINFNGLCNKIAALVAETINLDRLLELTTSKSTNQPTEAKPKKNKGYKIAVALDDAFCFIYHQNLEVLKHFGDVVFFSPLTDTALPGCDFLYLPGGYPELFARQLASNKSMLHSVRQYCTGNGKTYAECGGMMYLGKYITDKDGKQFEMAGFLPLATSMQNPALHLGYRSLFINGLNIKGHEFHYSTCLALGAIATLNCSMVNAKGASLPANMYRKNKTLASYNHLYWGQHTAFIEQLLQNSFYLP